VPYALALLLRVDDAGQAVHEAVGGVNAAEVEVELVREGLLHLDALAGAEQAVVHEDARGAAADGAVQQQRHHRAVDATREPAHHPPGLTHLLADRLHGRVDVRADRPVTGEPAHLDEEVPEHPAALGGVGHLGVELDTVQRQLRVPDRRDRACARLGDAAESLTDLHDPVAVGHPDGGVPSDAREQRVRGLEADPGAAVLVLVALVDPAAEGAGHELHAVADAQDGDAQPEDPGVDVRGVRLVARRRPAAEDHPAHAPLAELSGGDRVRHDLGVRVMLANAARDELRVLRAKIEDGDDIVGAYRAHGWAT
jgi:hypothetical protein